VSLAPLAEGITGRLRGSPTASAWLAPATRLPPDAMPEASPRLRVTWPRLRHGDAGQRRCARAPSGKPPPGRSLPARHMSAAIETPRVARLHLPDGDRERPGCPRSTRCRPRSAARCVPDAWPMRSGDHEQPGCAFPPPVQFPTRRRYFSRCGASTTFSGGACFWGYHRGPTSSLAWLVDVDATRGQRLEQPGRHYLSGLFDEVRIWRIARSR
jgi:hypothetical protein